MRIMNVRLNCLTLLLFSSMYSFGQAADPVARAQSHAFDSMLLNIKSILLNSKDAKSENEKVHMLNKLVGTIEDDYFKGYEKPVIPDVNTALPIIDEALSITNRLTDQKEKASIKTGLIKLKCCTVHDLALGAMVKGDYAEALKFFFNCLEIAEEINYTASIIIEYEGIGDVYYDIHNYNEALKYYLIGLKKKREAGWGNDMEFLLIGAGRAYQQLGNYNEALKCFFEARNEYNELRPASLLGDIRMRAYIGAVYKDMGDYTEALKYLIPALERYLKVTNNDRLFEVYTSIGTIYYRQAAEADSSEAKKKYTEAIDYLNKGLSLPKSKGVILTSDIPLEAYLSLSKSYKGIGDSKNSLYYLNKYLELKDSVYNADLYRKISVVNTQNELEKAQIEERARQDLLLANEKSTSERVLADQKLQQERIMADERVANEKKIAEQKLEQEKAIAKANSEKSFAVEKIRNEKQQTNNLLLMGLILAVMASVFLFFYLRQRNEKKRAVEKAEAIHKMAELEMQSLRSQLNPHFMFNSLNSLQTLILTEESDKSQTYLAQFSKMLRMLLENADKPFIPLQKEIDFLQLYLELEEMRVPDLQYSISTDPILNTEQTLIPNMILQPYVENAIWHGLSQKENDKKVEIRIYRQNGTVNCEVEDNGIGRKKAEELKSLFRKQHKSKGMELLTKRFKLLNEEYGSNIEAVITDMKKNDKDCGTLVTIKIPVMQSA